MTLYLKMDRRTNSWIPFLWMNDLHIVTRQCKQITRFHVFGTKGPMVLDWGVASVCGSPRSVQAVPMKKWLQHEAAWIEWQDLFQTLLSKYELGPSLYIFINPGRVLCVFCCVHLLWTERIASKQFPAACYLIAMLQRIHWKVPWLGGLLGNIAGLLVSTIGWSGFSTCWWSTISMQTVVSLQGLYAYCGARFALGKFLHIQNSFTTWSRFIVK